MGSKCHTTPKRMLLAVLVYALGFSILLYFLGVYIFLELPEFGNPILAGRRCYFIGCEPFGRDEFRGMLLFELLKAIFLLAPFALFLGKKLNRRRGALWFALMAGSITALFSEASVPILETLRVGFVVMEGLVFRVFLGLLVGTSSALAFWLVAMKESEVEA